MMSTPAAPPRYLERRRSLRVSVRLPLVICDGGRLHEQTCTLSVNSHGILASLAAEVKIGQRLIVHNPENWAERHARVSSLGRRYAGRTEVGLEFTEPAPDFWLIDTSSLAPEIGKQELIRSR